VHANFTPKHSPALGRWGEIGPNDKNEIFSDGINVKLFKIKITISVTDTHKERN
jgi:hypothetical protein